MRCIIPKKEGMLFNFHKIRIWVFLALATSTCTIKLLIKDKQSLNFNEKFYLKKDIISIESGMSVKGSNNELIYCTDYCFRKGVRNERIFCCPWYCLCWLYLYECLFPWTLETTGGLSGGAIAGIVIGVIAILVLIVVAALCLICRNRQSKGDSIDGG